jgi:Holliday junction resolvase RusA-like endonuclease
MSQSFSFFVPGIPKAQPRPRAFARKMGNGKFAARVYEAGTAENWKSCIAIAARRYYPDRSSLTGPLMLDIEFAMPRPKSHFRSGKRSNELRDDAPRWHSAKPDCDNLAKAVMDALTQLGGFWIDDSQACIVRISKRYTSNDPGALIEIVSAIPVIV